MDRLRVIAWQTLGQLLGRRGFVFILVLAVLPIAVAALYPWEIPVRRIE